VLNSNTISWIEECSKELSYDNRTRRVYPYLFDERLYIVNSTKKWEDASISDTNKYSFLKIKRIIKELRSKQYYSFKPEIWVNMYKNLSLNEKTNRIKPFILHSMTKILNVLSTNIEHQNFNNTSHNSLNQYSSIHGALSNIESKWQSYGSIYKGIIPSMLHPEIIIRIVRLIIHDVAFIHLFREFLYHIAFKKNRLKENIFGSYSINSLGVLLFNWYIVEYEKFFLVEIPRLLCSHDCLKNDTKNDFSVVQKMNILQSSILIEPNKWKNTFGPYIHIVNKNPKVIKNIFDGSKNNIYQYIRTKNLSFLNLETTQKNISILHKRYHNFLQYRFGYTNEINHWAYKCTESSDMFLGYMLQFKPRQILIRIYTHCDKARTTYVLNKSILMYNPLSWIIRILATYRFCTYFGYPISKSGWSTYSDLVIVDRFKRIKDSLVKYYSGSLNQKDLSTINHILHYSCAKTLACKHKTNLKKIWKKYGKNLSIRHPVEKRKTLQMSRTKTHNKARIYIRFWNFYYEQPDPMTILLEKEYRSSIK
jgi:hypothetical protein